MASMPASSTLKSVAPRPETQEETRARLDVPLSPVAAALLEKGLASAERGEIKPWDDFTLYAVEDDS
jgi:hypothetical protein